MRKGFIFTLDALLALLLTTVVVAGTFSLLRTEREVYSSYLVSQYQHTAENVLIVLRTAPLNQLVSSEIILKWSESGILDSEIVSPDMSPLDIVATYWATDPIFPEKDLKHKAEIILGYILNQTLKGYNYELLINNYTSPYLRRVGSNYSKAPYVSEATLLMSGYAYNQTPRGYMARAYLTRATSVREDLFGFMRVLAEAWAGIEWKNTLHIWSNELYVNATIYLPIDSKILEADGNFVKRSDEKMEVYINGNRVSLTSGAPNAPDIKDYLVPGDNVIEFKFYNSSSYWEMGIGSGTTIYVKYLSSIPYVEDPGVIKIYDVTSQYTGFIYLLENFVPGDIESINMKFKVKGAQVVRLYYGLGENLWLISEKYVDPASIETVEFTDDEIREGLSRIGVSYSNLSKMVFDFVLAVDAKYDENIGRFLYGGGYYFIWYNGEYYPITCPDCGGVRTRRLYGYPDSIIEIKYTPKILRTPYSIPVSIKVGYSDIKYSDYTGWNCGTDTYKSLSFKYTLPPYAEPWYVDLWVGYCFASSTTQRLIENRYEFYSGPNGVYSLRIAYTRLNEQYMMIPNQENTFTATLDVGVDEGGTSYRKGATRGVVKYFLNAYAGYGKVFPKYIREGCGGYNITYHWTDGINVYEDTITAGEEPYCQLSAEELLEGSKQYAVDDAIIRLFKNLGGYGTRDSPITVKLPENVNIEFASMGEIPGLFEPIQITLRVWRES